MEHIYSFLTDDEKITRKRWLAFFICNWVYGLIGGTVQSAPAFKELLKTNPHEFNTVAIPIIGALLVVLLLFAYIQYRCAYKKPGTKWLTLFLIAIPMSLAAMINSYFQSSKLHFPFMDSITVIFSIIGMFYHWKMRKINQRLRSIRPNYDIS